MMGTAEVNSTASGVESHTESSYERATRNWNEILQEARVIQTCTQIIGGFLLAVAFQPRFRDLDQYQLVLYLILVACAGVATALGLSLVLMHRHYFGKHQKIRIVRTGNRLLMCNLLVVSVLGLLVTTFVFDVAAGPIAGMIALAIGLLVTLILWIVIVKPGPPVQHD